MNEPIDDHGILAAEAEQVVILPANDFNVSIKDASFFVELDLHDPAVLCNKMHELTLAAYRRAETFLVAGGDELIALESPIADLLVSDGELEVLRQMTSLFAAHDKSVVAAMEPILERLSSVRETLAHYENNELSTQDLKSIKTALPSLLLSLRDISLYAKEQFDEIPQDDHVNFLLTGTARVRAMGFQGSVHSHILNGTPETAVKFVSRFGLRLSELASDIRMLCSPYLRFDSESSQDLFSSSHNLLIATDGIKADSGRASLQDFGMLRKAGAVFEPARIKFIEEFSPTR